MTDKISPLKAKPLRQAGQSVQEKLDKLFDEKLFLYAAIPGAMLGMVVMEWARYFTQKPPSPVLVTIITIVVTIYCIYKIFSYKNEIKRLKQGRDGEKAVGQYLDLLREEGCLIFHDILGDNFNIDHVVVSEKGVYCIETKTYSKPNKNNPQIHFNNGKLTIDGLGDKSEILIQIKSASNWLKNIIKESTGENIMVKPVVLFPGWWIDSKDFNEIWILEAKGFPGFLNNQHKEIPPDIKRMIGLHLSRFIRSL